MFKVHKSNSVLNFSFAYYAEITVSVFHEREIGVLNNAVSVILNGT